MVKHNRSVLSNAFAALEVSDNENNMNRQAEDPIDGSYRPRGYSQGLETESDAGQGSKSSWRTFEERKTIEASEGDEPKDPRTSKSNDANEVGESGWETIKGRKVSERAGPWRASKLPERHLSPDQWIPPGDWRKHKKDEIVDHRVQAGILPSSAKPGTEESIVPHGGKQQDFAEQMLLCKGKIIRHEDMHFFAGGDAPKDQGEVVTFSDGSQALKKLRYFLIVGRQEDMFFECPIYTFNGNGLRNRDETTWPEFFSIKPWYARHDEFINQSPGNEVLDISWMQSGRSMKDTMVVHLQDIRRREVRASADMIGSISSDAQEVVSRYVKRALRKQAELL